ncbi:MAG: HAD-IIIC family phosphatase [Bradyrhizobium sp.]|nr:HAD-IIIC family phosphatase [Bradyrhizobium sp.]
MTTLEVIEWQSTLFSNRLSRFEIMKLNGRQPAPTATVRVSRNHGFEQVASAIRPFLQFAGIAAALDIGDYDDAFTFPPRNADIEIVWIDYQRYAKLPVDELTAWFGTRLRALRGVTDAPIFVTDAPGDSDVVRRINETLADWIANTSDVEAIKLSDIATDLGPTFFDERRSAMTGTRFSDAACLEAARRLGLEFIPAAIGPMIKAVALDLDNTLYTGVLGEDGPNGVVLTEDHRALQQLLIDLTRCGIFLVVVSRNEPNDVAELFRSRSDFPLRAEMIADWQVSWGSKSQGILRAAETLRIAPDTFLFVDDNLGELTSVSRDLSEVRLVFAGNGGKETFDVLRQYPALWPKNISRTDTLRIADARANAERQELASKAPDATSYLRSLGVELTFSLNPADERARLAELAAKTNQFNLSLVRMSPVEIDRYLTDPDRRAVMFYMRDRLADSGSVGSILARRDGDVLVVDELCISCRAMGRCLEDIMVTIAIVGILAELPACSVRFNHSVGPRNKPARNWLSAYTGLQVGEESGSVDYPWDAERASTIIADAPIAVSWGRY